MFTATLDLLHKRLTDLEAHIINGDVANWNPTSEDSCSICLDPIIKEENNFEVLPCNDCFHKECIQAWLKAHTTCPDCRKEIPPSPKTHPDSSSPTNIQDYSYLFQKYWIQVELIENLFYQLTKIHGPHQHMKIVTITNKPINIDIFFKKIHSFEKKYHCKNLDPSIIKIIIAWLHGGIDNDDIFDLVESSI